MKRVESRKGRVFLQTLEERSGVHNALARLRVMVLVEAGVVSGSVKPVLEFAREAASREPATAPEISIASFMRNESENELSRTVRDQGIPWDSIVERSRFDHRKVEELRRAVERRRPHVIWTNASKSHFLVRFAGLHRVAKWVAYHHGYTGMSRAVRFYEQLDRWSLPAAARVITVCDAFAKELRKRGVSPESLFVQHTPIRPQGPLDTEAIAGLRAEFGIPKSTRIALAVGRLSREKGHADLVRAVALLRASMQAPPVKLLIVGEGPERGPLEKLIASLDLTADVLLPGHRQGIRDFYGMADVFVLPSHSEGSPNVLLEAMDAGTPVVATRVGGIPELAVDGRDALLVPARDVAAMADAMRRILEDDGLRRRLTGAASLVVSRQSPSEYYTRIMGLLQKVAVSG